MAKLRDINRKVAKPERDANSYSRKTMEGSIPFTKIYPDGVLQEQVENEKTEDIYSKLFRLIDINYSVEDEQEQTSLLTKYCAALNTMGDDLTAKLIIFNRRPDKQTEEGPLLDLPRQDEEHRQILRRELNAVISDKQKLRGERKLQTEKYFLLAVRKNSKEEADQFFISAERSLAEQLNAFGSGIGKIGDVERIRLLHDIYRRGSEDNFRYDPADLRRQGLTAKDAIFPFGFSVEPKYIKIGNSFAKGMILLNFPQYVSDDFVRQLAERCTTNMLITVSMVPVDRTNALDRLDQIEKEIEKEAEKFHQKKFEKKNPNAPLPSYLRRDRVLVEELRADIMERDQNIFFMGVSMVVMADTEKELKTECDKLKSYVRANHFKLVTNDYLQEETFNHTLPYGARYLNNIWRDATTDTIAAFNPFVTKELVHENGRWMGNNRITGGVICPDVSLLENANTLIFGSSGFGKSMLEKIDILMELLGKFGDNTDFLIIDPEGEWQNIARYLYGDLFMFSAGSAMHLNPLKLTEQQYLERGDNIYAMKSEFLLTVVRMMLNMEKKDSRMESIVDRCLRKVCKKVDEPTLTDVWHELYEQEEEIAQDIALGLEIYVEGALNIFAHKNNMERKSNFTVYDTSALGKNIMAVSTFTIMESIFDIVARNFKIGRRTVIVIEEFHMFSDNEVTAEYMDKMWRRYRKYGGRVVGSTQQLEDLVKTDKGRTYIENSELVVMLRQKPHNLRLIQESYNLSASQCKFIENAPQGCGLLGFGKTYIPFEKVIDRSIAPTLYDLLTTKPEEGYGVQEK